METILLVIIIALVEFGIYKTLVVLVSKLLTKLLRIKENKEASFDIWVSIGVLLFSVFSWVVGMFLVSPKYQFDNMAFYISFCMIGVLCVFWSYFSWDIEQFWAKPYKAKKEERRIKKIVLYVLVCIFVFFQGYYQTLSAMGISVKVNVLFQVTNYSAVVIAIALDRIMNQICQDESASKEEEKVHNK